MKRFLLIGWILAMMTSCEEFQRKRGVERAERPWEVNLSGEWKFSIGDDEKWAAPGFDDHTWEMIHAPGLWDGQGYADYDGFGWYRKQFHVPRELEGKELIFEHGGVDDDDMVFVNGAKIGEGKGCYKPRSYRVPAGIVKYGQENLIAVRIFDGGMGGGLAHAPLRIRAATLSDRISVEAVRIKGAPNSALLVTLKDKENAGHHIEVRYRIADHFLQTAGEGTVGAEFPAEGAATVEAPFNGGDSKDYRVLLRLSEKGESCEMYRLLPAERTVGLRESVLLSGEWEILFPADGKPSFPPKGEWKKFAVPNSKWGGGWDAKKHCAWYRRSFPVPQEMSGKRIKLRFLGVGHQAAVWVNGRNVGEHLGGFEPFEFDVTDAIKMDADNEMVVGVTDWTVGLINVKDIPEDMEKLPPDSMIIPYGCRPPAKVGIWQDAYLVGYPDVRVGDVFVTTSVRGKKLAVRIEVRNESRQPREIVIKNEVWDGDKKLFSLADEKASVAPAKGAAINVSKAWQSPRLWWPHDPHLYRLRTTIISGGKTIDRLDTRFGFREFWIDGIDYRLNGLIFRLRGLCCPPTEASREEIREYYLSRMDSNFSLVRFHMQPRAEYYYDIADEVGMCVKDESAFYCAARTYALKDDRLWRNLADHIRGMVLRSRSHPSLCIWSVENEILHCGGTREKETAARMFELGEIIRQLDATRPIEYEGDGDVEGRAETINIHYPREFGCHNHNLWPNDAYWLGAEGNDRWPKDLVWKKDKPMILGEFNYFPYSRPPGGESLLIGDEAYESREGTDRAHRLAVKILCDGCRRAGATGLNPWVTDPRYAEECLKPVVVTFKEYDGNFFAGEQVTRHLAVHNDMLFADTFILSCEISAGGKCIAREQTALRMTPGEMKEVPISWTMPEVAARTEALLDVRLQMGDETVFEDKKAFSVFPPVSIQVPSGLKVSIFDRNGQTTGALQTMSLSVSPVEGLDRVSRSNTDLLLIGSQSAAKDIEPHADRLKQFVAEGGRVFCFEQDEPFNWLPVDLRVDPKHSSTMVFRRLAEHPMLRDIEADDLKFWRGDHVVSVKNFLKPHKGNFAIIADAGGNGGMKWTPLVEVRHGQGFFMLSQLALTAKLETEPAARMLLRNLLDYAASYRAPVARKVAVVASKDEGLRQYLFSLGLEYDDLSSGFPTADLSPYGILLLGRGEPGLSQTAKIREFADAGGSVLIHCPGADDAAKLKALAPGLAAIAACKSSGSLVKLRDEFPLCGLTNSDFFWYVNDCWYEDWEGRGSGRIDDPAKTIFRISDGATALVRPAALVKAPVGKGWIMLDAIRWDEAEARVADKCARIATTLLSNLGARFGHGTRLTNLTYTPIPIAAHLNRKLQDDAEGDGKGGWTDQGNNDMRNLPKGKQTLAGASFEIGDGCIVLRSPKHAPNCPPRVDGIKVGWKFDYLAFLQTAAWCGAETGKVATCEVVYRDGSKTAIEMVSGANVADWWNPRDDLPMAQLAYKGSNPVHTPVGLYSFIWRNPHPSKEITLLNLVSAETDAIPIFVAVTGAQGATSK